MKYSFVTVIILSVFLSSCSNSLTKEPPEQLDKAVLIPKPVSVNNGDGFFVLNADTRIMAADTAGELGRIANMFAQKMSAGFEQDYTVGLTAPAAVAENAVLLLIDPALTEKEAYKLVIDKKGVKISGSTPEGVFRGVQTLMQLLPAEFGTEGNEAYAISSGSIEDQPAYGFRSSMLDVSRHFFDVEEVKRYIDLISFYKMNMLHLHLSDDQGWRIEIKSWPRLTSHGGSLEVGGGKGGFYTQEQYKELVQYAQDRYVTIIPEIDMPGHTNAALASYAELNCNDTAVALYTNTEVGFSTLCVRKDITYRFIDDVVRELAAITPGPYIHLGGDESHVTSKEDFIYFINRIQEIPPRYGKKMIGWEEIAQAELLPTTIVQYWSNPEHAKEAVKKGADIIMSPAQRTYLDMKYDSTTELGLKWAGLIEVDSAYAWSPESWVEGISEDHILGIEAPLWTETLTNIDEVEFMVFPRLPGLAELGWSPAAGRNWEEYRQRLARHGQRMKAMDIDYYESPKVSWNK